MRDFTRISHFLLQQFLYLFPFNRIRSFQCLEKGLCYFVKLINREHFVFAKEYLRSMYILNKYFYTFFSISFANILYLFIQIVNNTLIPFDKSG